ncbi:transcription repressor OFP1-like [Salvia miltiorrhiza]|uniref:transcription repressor OFP1-like n=1 Tax=Salvia miltiorrhiza TaxID=226208 RepID=UPI0025AD8829|nr:transcription repressor OFP1-like [Salvia miltiorrhiza]
MDNHHIMLKISRLFPSSFTSCQFRNVADVAESSIPVAKHPSLSPPSKAPHHHPPRAAVSSTSNGGSWFTASDTETFPSLSSNSGDSFHLRAASARFKQMKSIDEAQAPRSSLSSSCSAAAKCRRRAAGKRPAEAIPRHQLMHEMGTDDHVSTRLYYGGGGGGGCRRRRRRRIKKNGGEGVVMGGSYAVEKSSRDPRGDFRASMVEMIVEKQMFAAADLERLLRCFLSLNSAAYHAVIFDVFSEICQTLFTN